MKRMIVIDGNSIMFRAYYATAAMGNLMQTRSGLYTNALYGFVNMINYVLKKLNPSNIFVAFDKGKKTIRHLEYSDYKGGRKKTPEEFLMQIPFIKEYLDVINIKHLELDDYEADDIVGSMATLASPYFDEVMVISGDKDLLQLANNNVHVYLTKRGLTDLECYTEENFKSILGIESNQMTDYKGLLGDSSDNLPGVAGIGPKSAVKLLEEYKTLEAIIDAAPTQLKGKLQENILRDKDIALMCKRLAKLYTNVDLGISLDDTKVSKTSNKVLREFYSRFDFKSFINKLSDDDNQEKQNTSNKSELFNDSNDIKTVNIACKVEYIKYINEVELLVSELSSCNIITAEVELTGDNYHTEDVLGISIKVNNHLHYISKCNISEKVKELLSRDDLTIYTNDAKKVYVSLYKLGINIQNIAFDLSIASYIVNPSYSSNDIKIIYDYFIDNNIPSINTVYGKKSTYIIPDEDTYIAYSFEKIKYLEEVKLILEKTIKENNQEELYYNIDLPLAKTLSMMEVSGFKVSIDTLNEIGKNVLNQMELLENDIYKAAGCTFNISSPKQLGEVLFDKLQLAKGKKNKTGYQTGADVLEKLSHLHPVPSLVLEYRKYAKIYSTYVVGLIDVIQQDNKVHTIFKQSLTLTGRLSSTEPNIQNIPIRTQEGRLIRGAFIPSTNNGILVSADYSQIELRILAHLSNCKNMLDAFNSGEDLHARTAASIYAKPIEDITKEERRMAKAVNFGIVYGMSAWGLSEELHISVQLAAEFIDKYFTIYPEIKTYLDSVVKFASEYGYTKTLFNRRRYIPELSSPNKALREFGERTAKNAPIQGSAADIIKIAMINVANKINELSLKSKLIAQVHDELVIDTVYEEKDIVEKLLKETMESVVNLKVALNVEVSTGNNWNMK